MNPHHLGARHVGDDFLGHSNGSVPTPFSSPNFACNNLAIGLLLDDVGGSLHLVLAVGLGVEERVLDGGVLLVLFFLVHLLIFVDHGLPLDLWTLVGLVAFTMALEAYHGFSLLKLLEEVGHSSPCLWSCPSSLPMPS